MPSGWRYTPAGHTVAGMDSDWEQKNLKPRIREILDTKRGGESHLPNARCVNARCVRRTFLEDH